MPAAPSDPVNMPIWKNAFQVG
uniref:Uncharacterized protein n=1 Tax=Anguilla anguilla TaxID=7936 RepID=A0A0E9TQA1_ANGAN